MVSNVTAQGSKIVLENDASFSSLQQGIGIGSDRTNSFKLNYKRRDLDILWDKEILEVLYEVNPYAANLIDNLPESMGKFPPIFGEFESADIATKINKNLVDVIPYFVDAYKKARLMGGAGILIGTPGELTEPVDSYQQLPTYFTVFEGGRLGKLQILEICKDPTDPNYLKPLWYGLKNHRGIKIHASRIIPFYGIKCLTESELKHYKYWGIPVLIRSYDEIRNLDIYDQTISNSLPTINRLVMEIPNYDALTKTPTGRSELRHRLSETARAWSVNKILPVSQDTKVTNIKIDFASLETPGKHIKESLASTSNIPYEKLFNVSRSGRSLSGNSSSSQSNDRQGERQWADITQTAQVKEWQPGIEGLIKVIWFPVYGIDTDTDYNLEWPTIMQLTEAEEASIQKDESTSAKNYIDSGVLKPEVVQTAIKNKVDYSTALKDEDNKIVDPVQLLNLINASVTKLHPLQMQGKLLNAAEAIRPVIESTGVMSPMEMAIAVAKAKTVLDSLITDSWGESKTVLDYNHNHGERGRFSSSNSAGGGSHQSGGSGSNTGNENQTEKKGGLKEAAKNLALNIGVPSVAGIAAGKVVGAIAASHGFDPHMASNIASVGVKALTSTAMFARSGDKTPQQLVAHFISSASAGTVAKLTGANIEAIGNIAHASSHIHGLIDALHSNGAIIGHIADKGGKIGAASIGGIGTGQLAARTGAANSIAGKLVSQGRSLQEILHSRSVGFGRDSDDGNGLSNSLTLDDLIPGIGENLSPEQQQALFDLSLVALLFENSDFPDNGINQTSQINSKTVLDFMELDQDQEIADITEIIESIYLQQISNVTISQKKEGAIYGTFQNNNGGLSFVYKIYDANSPKISYKLTAGNVEQQNELNTDSIEFVIDKNCSKGISCGATCIASTKICRKGLKGGAASKASELLGGGSSIAQQGQVESQGFSDLSGLFGKEKKKPKKEEIPKQETAEKDIFESGEEGSYAAGFRNNVTNWEHKMNQPGWEKPPPPPSATELAGVNYYTGPHYREMNNYLRNGKEGLNKVSDEKGDYLDRSAKDFDAIIKTTNSGLSQLPNYEGVVHRGTDINQNKIDQYKVGETYTEKGFVSTSTSKGISGDFKGGTYTPPGVEPKIPVSYVITSKTGTQVQRYSSMKNEKEVLFKSGTEFNVTAKKQNKDGSYTIHMEEI